MPTEGPERGKHRAKPSGRPQNVSIGLIVAVVFGAAVLAITFGFDHRPGARGPNTPANAVAIPG